MSKKNPRVSVIIPTYNRAETLKSAIKSVLWQTFTDFEFLVVGDHCTDHTEEMIADFNKEGANIKWYNLEKNSGYQSEPINQMLDIAKGEYISYLNHDDVWLPRHLEIMVNFLDENPDVDLAYGIMEWILSFAPSYPDIPRLPDLPRSPEATSFMHRSSMIEKVGKWKQIHETYSFPRVEWLRRARFKGCKFEIVPAMTALKFLWDEKSYAEAGPQEQLLERVANEPDFIEKELAGMLIRSYAELESLITWKRLKKQLADVVRIFFIRRNIDPASLKFWSGRGKQIRVWRKRHRLK